MNTKANTKENEDVLVNLDLDNNIGTLQLNRPSKLNALRYQTLNSLEETLEFSFETTATTFESLFASKGYSLSFDYTSSSNINGNYTFVYSFEISDGYMNISLNQTASF